MKHLLGINGISKDDIQMILHNAEHFRQVNARQIKKVPSLRGRTVVNLFLEPSTRTRTSFEIAAKRLSAEVINITATGSSIEKGETLLDTVRNLKAIGPDIIVMRHKSSSAPRYVAERLPEMSIINAGDGTNEHPSQALLDLLTIKRARGSIDGVKIAIIGDIVHSRVCRSLILALAHFNADIRLCAPRSLLPEYMASYFATIGRVKNYSAIHEAIEGADVVYCLRMQLERQGAHFVPSLADYSTDFAVREELLTKFAPGAILMHPGPINRGVEVSSAAVDSSNSHVLEQVTNGVAVRMAILYSVLANSEIKFSEEGHGDTTSY